MEFEVKPADVHEDKDGAPATVVSANALRKAKAVADVAAQQPVLGVDTTVFIEGKMHGKPRDRSEARSYLELLSGRSHDVWSGLALVEGASERLGTARTAVRFRPLDRQMLEWYIDTGEWRGRAGAYAIQGKGSALVERIEGDFWNVVGLPVAVLLDMAPGLVVR